jgi:hypothetical protein
MKRRGITMPDPDETVDLTALSDDELNGRESELVERFDALSDDDNADVGEIASVADQIESVRSERTNREQAAAEAAQRREELRQRVHANDAPAEGEEGAEEDESDEGDDTETQGLAASGRNRAPLGQVRERAPKVKAPRRVDEPVLVASADIPGFTQGGKLNGWEGVAAAARARTRALPVTANGQGTPVNIAQLQRKFNYTLGLDSSPREVNEVLTAATNPETLTAAGGWCAPSEISYDFYNVVAEDGMVDLPTVGVNRGGIRFPTSPSFGDVNTIANVVWSWSETQDVAAVTGTGQSGTKPCVRVPCPSFNEVRLGCDGICVTVGNLTEDAYPEMIANHLKLVSSVQAHYTNARIINQLVSLSNISVTGLGAGGAGYIAPLLAAIEMHAVDYRIKYRMAENATLEVILPIWAKAPARQDLSKRMGLDPSEAMNITDQQITSWFESRGVSVQFVHDWQLTSFGQTTPLAAWPTSVTFMMYSAGTFVLGKGLTLDLGVVRDSVLNSTNDHTAAWMEECYLVAKMGHESRLVTVNVCPDGTTGAADLTACGI